MAVITPMIYRWPVVILRLGFPSQVMVPVWRRTIVTLVIHCFTDIICFLPGISTTFLMEFQASGLTRMLLFVFSFSAFSQTFAVAQLSLCCCCLWVQLCSAWLSQCVAKTVGSMLLEVGKNFIIPIFLYIFDYPRYFLQIIETSWFLSHNAYILRYYESYFL